MSKLVEIFGTDDIDKIFEIKESKDFNNRHECAIGKSSQVKLTPAKCKALCDKIGLEYHEGLEERVIQYVLTNETVDRYGDVVIAEGADLKNYMSNPVVLTFHDYHQYPVGRSLKTWVDKEGKQVLGWLLFFDDEIDNTGVSETVFKMAKAGAMNTGSIGFLPSEYHRPDEKERKMRKMPEHGYVYDKWEMLEFSLVPVPANPDAKQNMIIKSADTEGAKQFKALVEKLMGNNDSTDTQTAVSTDDKQVQHDVNLQNGTDNDIIKDMEGLKAKISEISDELKSIKSALSMVSDVVRGLNDNVMAKEMPDSGAMGDDEPDNSDEPDGDEINDTISSTIEEINNLEV